MKRLILSLAALSVLAPSAWSDVIYSGYQNLAVPQTFDGVYLNINTGATAFAQPGDYNTAPWINPFFGGVDIGTGALLRPVITGADQIVNLATGTLVSSGSMFAMGESGSSTHVGAGPNQFTLGTPGNIGFQFEASPGGTTQFGSLNITINNASAGVIRDWAYDNAGGSIVVGRVQQSAPAAGAQTFTLSPGTGESFTLASAITDTGGNINSVLKTGDGATTLGTDNTYTGTTSVNGGTLEVGAGGGELSGTTSVTVNNGGTLLLNGAGNDRINDAAGVNLAGGVLNTGGLSEGTAATAGLGALTLSGNSTLDLGSGASVIHFADSQLAMWTSGTLLTITNWSGSPTGGGVDQVFFGSSQSALTSSQLEQIQFDLGGGQFAPAGLLASGELVAIPEPGTILAAAALLGFAGWRERRRFLGKRLSPAGR